MIIATLIILVLGLLFALGGGGIYIAEAVANLNQPSPAQKVFFIVFLVGTIIFMVGCIMLLIMIF